ncbi:Ig-like domain-containing protein [Clostridium botulinum C]|uniref:Ig-like domain-containing protein n=1 Tax=Clostridium botulinum TaxID=1491 RepID=UPI001E358C67|nr:Ig-like domain-containing protein [Clostridium botulinum]MCD3246264.1 Ig-like domain-containing protein [Clostridium botulinum C]MCD3260700.1 Ig-like domain-containing protein [Clostridium botulinum C]
MKNNKKVALLSSAAIGTLIATALTTTAYAKIDSILTEKDGKFFEYSYKDLLEASELDAAGVESPLFKQYLDQQLKAFHDDVKGYINEKIVMEAAEEAAGNEEEFNLDDYIKNTNLKDNLVKVDNITKLTEQDGKVVEVKNENKTELKVESVSSINETEITVKLTDAVKEVTADKFQLTINDGEVFNPAEVKEDATDATGKTFKLKLKDSLTNTQGVLKVNGIAKANLENSSVNFDFKKPEMVKAEVLDERHVKVTFSEEMSTEVKEIDNVEIAKITDNDDVLTKGKGTDGFGVLSSDKKSVIYTLASDKNLVPAKYVVRAKTAELKDCNNNAVVENSEIYFQATGDNLKDVTAPKVTGASFDSSTKQLKLTFDEAIKDTNSAKGVTFAGVALTEAAVVGGNNKNEVTITISDDNLAKLNLKGDVKVAIKDAFQDEAENKVVGEIKATLVTPPVLATKDAKDSNFDETTRILTIKFNEAVKDVDVTKISIDNEGDVAQALSNEDKVVEETKGTDTIKIQLSKGSYRNIKLKDNKVKTAGLTIAEGAVKNLDGTANKAIDKVEVAYIQDEKAPVVTEATFNNRTHELEIKFDEAIEVKNHANIKLTHRDAETTLDTLAGANIAADVNATDTIKFKVIDGQVATVKTWFNDGKVNIITTAKGDIEDYAGNQVDIIAKGEKAPVVTLIDQIAPKADETQLEVLSKTKLTVKFSEIMDKASAQIAENYKVYDLQNDKDIVATSAVLDEDGKTVILTFGEELNVPNENNYKVIVNNVKDKAGNRIANDTEWQAFSMQEGDKDAPTVSEAKFTNKETNSIVIKFSKKVNVEEAANLANYELVKDNKAYDLTNAKIVTSTVGNSTVATITFDNVIPTDISGLTLKAKNIHDIAGNKITEAPAEVKKDEAKTDAGVPTYVATLLDGSNGQNDRIKISFSKPVNAEEATKKENYTITEAKDTQDLPKKIDGLAIESISDYDKELNQVVITLNKNNVGSLKLAVGENKILDITGHAVAKDAKELKVIDLSAPAIKEAKAEAKFANGEDTVSVEFDEEVFTDNAGKSKLANAKDVLVVKVGDTVLTGTEGDSGWKIGKNKATLTITNRELKKGDIVTISLKDGQKLYDKSGNVLDKLSQDVKVVTEGEEFNVPEKVTYAEATNSVELEFAHEVDSNSIKADGSDFVVKGYTVQNAVVDKSCKKVTVKIAEKVEAGDLIVSLAKDSNLCDGVGNKLVADELGKVKVEAKVVVPEDKVAPTLTKTEIDGEKKVVTLTFSEPIERQVESEESLKAAITFAANGSDFSALAKEDKVEISGNTLKVTFNSPISRETNKIKINAAALKDAAGNKTIEIKTDAIKAN